VKSRFSFIWGEVIENGPHETPAAGTTFTPLRNHRGAKFVYGFSGTARRWPVPSRYDCGHSSGRWLRARNPGRVRSRELERLPDYSCGLPTTGGSVTVTIGATVGDAPGDCTLVQAFTVPSQNNAGTLSLSATGPTNFTTTQCPVTFIGSLTVTAGVAPVPFPTNAFGNPEDDVTVIPQFQYQECSGVNNSECLIHDSGTNTVNVYVTPPPVGSCSSQHLRPIINPRANLEPGRAANSKTRSANVSRKADDCVNGPSPPPANPSPTPSPTPVISAMILAQAVQSVPQSLPLVANRQALARVFVVGPVSGIAAPSISLQIGTSPPVTVTPPQGMSTLPISLNEGTINTSYNVLVPSSAVAPGIQLRASLLDNSGNPYNPATPVSVNVLTSQPLQVPILAVQLSHSLGNAQSVTGTFAQNVLFAPSVAFVQTGYTVKEPSIDAVTSDTDGQILTEVQRTAEDHGYLLGPGVKALGIFGRVSSGDEGGSAQLNGNAALVFDGSAPADQPGPVNLPLVEQIAAHEVAHTLGLHHANTGLCSSPLGETAGAPFSNTGATIGHFGYDLTKGIPAALISPTTYDYMGYCAPPTWTSDVDWKTLAVAEQSAGAGSARVRRTLVLSESEPYILSVSGETSPKLRFYTPRTYATSLDMNNFGPGNDIVEGFDILGNLLFVSPQFGALPMADSPTGHDIFSIEIPITTQQYISLHSLRLTANGQALTATSNASGPPVAVATDTNGSGNVLIRWNGSMYPVLYVHTSDGSETVLRNGNVLATGIVNTHDSSLTIEFCDGVKSVFVTIPVIACGSACAPTPAQRSSRS